MRFVQIDVLPSGKALVDVDKLTHAVPDGQGSSGVNRGRPEPTASVRRSSSPDRPPLS